MGDRSNIVIQEQGERVWLYGHWMGARSIGHAAHGLRSGRADDAAYLARIVFCSMLEGDVHGEIGFGISASCHDNQNPILVIDVECTSTTSRTTVWFEDREGVRVSRILDRDEFLALEAESTWRTCHGFDPAVVHEAHEWPFEPFLRDAPDEHAASRVRDTGWPQLVRSTESGELELARGGPQPRDRASAPGTAVPEPADGWSRPAGSADDPAV